MTFAYMSILITKLSLYCEDFVVSVPFGWFAEFMQLCPIHLSFPIEFNPDGSSLLDRLSELSQHTFCARSCELQVNAKNCDGYFNS